MFRMFSRLLCRADNRSTARSIACAWSRPGASAASSCEGGFCVRPRKCRLSDALALIAEADLAVEENVDTLSLPYGHRHHSPVHPRDARLVTSSRKGLLVTPPRPLSKASPYSQCRCFVRPPSDCNPVPSGRPAGRSAVVALLAVSPTMVDPRSPPQRKKRLVDAAS